VALFTDHLPSRPSYIVGQIVHIERQAVKPLHPASTRPEHGRADQLDLLTTDQGTDLLNFNLGSTSNPYNLPMGCEYFVVTVAMLPDTTIHSAPPSWSPASGRQDVMEETKCTYIIIYIKKRWAFIWELNFFFLSVQLIIQIKLISPLYINLLFLSMYRNCEYSSISGTLIEIPHLFFFQNICLFFW